MKNWKNFIKLFGILLFVFILSKLDFKYYLFNLPQINWFFLSFCLPLIFINLLLNVFRWQLILKKQGIIYKISKTFNLYLAGLYMGSVTPGRLGELGKAYYIKKDDHQVNNSFLISFIDKVFDLIFVLFVAALSMIYFSEIKIKYSLWWLLIIIPFTISYWVIKRYFTHHHIKLIDWLKSLIDGLKKFSLFDSICIFILTAFSWLTYYCIAYVITISLGIKNINFLYSSMVMNLSSLTAVLPISIMGVGTRDSIFVFFYYLKGQPKELSVAVSMLILLSNIILIGCGLVAWLKIEKNYRKKINRA